MIWQNPESRISNLEIGFKSQKFLYMAFKLVYSTSDNFNILHIVFLLVYLPDWGNCCGNWTRKFRISLNVMP